MARLHYKNGAVVDVPDEKVETLVRNGFTAESKQATKKATRRKASSDESEK